MSDIDSEVLFVDAHVHVYDCFDIDELLDAALRNFTGAAKKLGLNNGFTGVLLLTETSRDNWFQQSSKRSYIGRWLVEATPDKAVLQARQKTDDNDHNNLIYIMAGRQIITAEGFFLS